MDSEVADARVVARLTAFAPLSDLCLVGGTIYFINSQASWNVLRMENDAFFEAACRLLTRIGTPQFGTSDEWSEWVRRTAPLAGGFLYDGQRYRFAKASCTWQADAGLTVKAIGANCSLDLAGIPFQDAERISDLEGCGWPPGSHNGIRRPRVGPPACIVEVEGRKISVAALEFHCGAYHAEPATLNVFFQGSVQDSVSGDDQSISGSVYCRVVA